MEALALELACPSSRRSVLSPQTWHGATPEQGCISRPSNSLRACLKMYRFEVPVEGIGRKQRGSTSHLDPPPELNDATTTEPSLCAALRGFHRATDWLSL